MLSWALTFLLIAIIAAVMGFGGLAGTLTWLAQAGVGIFLILFVLSVLRGRRGPAR